MVSAPIEINGSWGEGGGQILRTCLSLAAIARQPLRLDRIRAHRKNPGLAAQHLTAVRAAAAICQAQVRGDALGSTTLEFVPSCPPQAGEYAFDVSQATESGSAGAATLILQTILLPLVLATGNSQVTLKGGTHVPWSPSATYIEQVYLPLLNRWGISARLQLNAWGWYPRGGGEIVLHVTGRGGMTLPMAGFTLLERGTLQAVRGLAVVTELPSHIPQRMANRAENLLREAESLQGVPTMKVQPLRAKGVVPGAGIFLTAEYEQTRAGFGALGRIGLPAERVAQMAVEEFLQFHESGAAVEPFLADQLLLPAALASGTSRYRVAELTQHLTTNAWVIEQFGLARIAIDHETQVVTVIPESATNRV